MKTRDELSTAKPIVAVVNSDPAVRNSLRFSLEVEGLAVREYPAGADLLKDVEHAAVDSLVLDERMPAMSGLDTIARLRELNISVPTMLMASRLTPALRERVRRAGVSVVEKPLLGDALIEWIRKAFSPAINTG
jgi:two-component system response regulator FixJ